MTSQVRRIALFTGWRGDFRNISPQLLKATQLLAG